MNTTEILKAYAPEFVEEYKMAQFALKIFNTERDNSLEDAFCKMADAHAHALLKLAEREWRPIETAPQNGERVHLGSAWQPDQAIASWNVDLHDWQVAHKYGNDPIDFIPTSWKPIPRKPPGEVATLNASNDAEIEPKTLSEVATPSSQISSQITTLQEKLESAKGDLTEIIYSAEEGGTCYDSVRSALNYCLATARACLAELEGKA